MVDAADSILIDTVKKNIDHFEDIVDKILDTPYKLNFTQENYQGNPNITVEYKNGKVHEHVMLLIGKYLEKKHEWNWFPGMNKLFELPDLKKEMMMYYGGFSTLNKIFSDKVKIDSRDHIIIPYIFAIHVNKTKVMNLMRIAGKNVLLYVLIDLKLKPEFNMKKYFESLKPLRIFNQTYNELKENEEKKMSRTSEKKTSKKTSKKLSSKKSSKKIRNLSRLNIKL